jgi:hypothetical protein
MFVGHGPFPLGVVTSRILPDLRFSVSSLLQKTFYTNWNEKQISNSFFVGIRSENRVVTRVPNFS